MKGWSVRISIFGLGYVGTVSAGCLARDGHYIVGVDPVPLKVELIRRGQSPIVEEGISEIIREANAAGLLHATRDAEEAIRETDVSFVCVGTPSQQNGNLDLRYIRRICEEIGSALRSKPKHHTVVIRSTVLPGTMRKIVVPVLEDSSGKRLETDLASAITRSSCGKDLLLEIFAFLRRR